MSETLPQSAAKPADLRLTALHDAIRSPRVRAVSTDVFDTLVWRQVPEPVDAFPILGERLRAQGALADSLTVPAFAQLRRVAERRARAQRRARSGDTEVRLDEIYELIPPWVLAWSPREAAMQVELDVERELLVPDLDVVAFLARARRAGKTIVAISDTYFSEAQLRELLDQPVLADVPLERVFTSSDHRKGKADGLLTVALRTLMLGPDQMVHLGDSRAADIEPAKELGMTAFHFDRRPEPFATVADAEAPFLPPPAGTAGAATLVSGLTATRTKVLSRSQLAAVPAPLQPFWTYGATVLGPLFAGFAEWVHEQCERTGAIRVGCLMREGAFLGELLRHANPYLGRELEAVPLWLNRDLCLRASVADGSWEELERLLARRSAPTAGGLLSLLGVPLSRLPEWTSHAGTSLEDPVVRHNVFAAISSDERVRAEIGQRSRALRERIAAYVDRLCGGDGPLTLVDLGWGASIQALLHRVLEQAGAPRPTVGLYLLTHEAAAEQVVAQRIEAHGFLGEYGYPDSTVRTVMRSPELLEQICMPPHGTQLDLGEDFEPRLADSELPRLQLVEAETVRKGVLAYQREWARYQTALPGKLAPLSRARHLLRPILLRSVVAPTKEEVGIFGGWHHDEGQGSTRTDPIVDPADAGRLRYMSPDQARALPMSDVYWPFAAAALADPHWAALMRLAAAGELSWEELDAPLETGAFRINATGVDVPPDSEIVALPTRNRFGLSSARGTLRAPFVQEVHIRPAQHPAVVRMDSIRLRCHVQGQPERIEVLFEGGSLAQWRTSTAFVLSPGVYISYEGTGSLALRVAAITRRVVFRVDVECAFAALPIPPVLPAGGRFGSLQEAEGALRGLESSLSWRVTAPLRKAKGKLLPAGISPARRR